MFAVIVIGERGNLSKQVAHQRAIAATTAINQMAPHEMAELSVWGYDDDPREVWDIMEVRDYFIAFFEEMKKQKVVIERVLPQSLSTLAACYAAREGKKVITIGTKEDTVREGAEQMLRHRRSHLH